MSRENMLKKLGLTESVTKPNPITDKERIEAIEEAISELAEIMLGGEE